VIEAKDTKNNSKWLEKAGQDSNIEANYDTQGNLNEVAKKTTERKSL
jgi:hypothetical protein